MTSPLAESQRQIQASYGRIVPKRVRSILDVGVGVGTVSNQFVRDYEVTGLDIDERVMDGFLGKKVVGSILDLPFGDAEFDLVMCNDVIEHIDPRSVPLAISELCRVSSRFLTIGVPYSEPLSTGLVRCADCGSQHHANGHLHSIGIEEIRSWITPGHRLRELRFSGDLVRAHAAPPTEERSSTHAWSVISSVPCPACGSLRQVANAQEAERESKEIQKYRAGQLRKAAFEIPRSEIIGLLSREDDPWHDPAGWHSPTVTRAIDFLDFQNSVQEVEEFNIYDQWARYRAYPSVRSPLSGGLLAPKDGLDIICSIPVCGAQDEYVLSVIDERVSGGSDSKFDSNRAPERSFPVLEVLLASGEYVVLPTVPGDDLKWSLAGHASESSRVILRLRIPWRFVPLSLERCPGEGEKSPTLDGVRAAIGPNLVELTSASPRITWSFESSSPGWVPLFHRFRKPDSVGLGFAEASETTRQWLKDRADLSALHEGHFGAPWTEAAAMGDSCDVLVLSSMFPRPAIPANGIFVKEQVEAIRNSTGLDARVCCGLPVFRPDPRRHPRWAWSCWRRFRAGAFAGWKCLSGVPAGYFEYWPSYLKGQQPRSYLRAMKRLGLPVPRVIHAHTGFLDGWAGSKLAQAWNVPLVITEHIGPVSTILEPPTMRRRVLEAYEAAQDIIAVSEFQANEIRRRVPASLARKVSVLGNGVPSERFNPPISGNRIHATKIRILFAGFLCRIKSIETLIKAVHQLKARGFELDLLIAGDTAEPDYAKELEGLIVELGLAEDVRRLGGLTREQIAIAMREEADVLVLPSKAETFGCVCVEALASGLPVVVSDCGGADEYRDIRGVRVVPVGDTSNMASAIVDAAGVPDEVDIDATLARFDFSTIAEHLGKIYARSL